MGHFFFRMTVLLEIDVISDKFGQIGRREFQVGLNTEVVGTVIGLDKFVAWDVDVARYVY